MNEGREDASRPGVELLGLNDTPHVPILARVAWTAEGQGDTWSYAAFNAHDLASRKDALEHQRRVEADGNRVDLFLAECALRVHSLEPFHQEEP